MNSNTDLDKFLFQKSNQPKPSHNPDITITSYSDVSDGTPNKQLLKLPTKIKQEENQILMKASDSIMESMTPKKINKLIDWSKYNVNPGNGKNIFPQVAGISIEFSNENSLNFKQQVKTIDDNLPNKFIEKESKLDDFSNLEVITKKNEQLESTSIESLNEIIQLKEETINQLKIEIAQLQSQTQTFQQELDKIYKVLLSKDSMIEIQELQISNLKNLCKSQQQDQIILSDNKIIDFQKSSSNNTNILCLYCQNAKQELRNILIECSLKNDLVTINSENDLSIQIRDIVTILLTKQREQIDIVLEQQDEQIKDLTDQIQQCKEQKFQVQEENDNMQKKIKQIFNEQQENEKLLFEELEIIKKTNYSLVQENQYYKQQTQLSNSNYQFSKIDYEKLQGYQSIQLEKQEANIYTNQMRLQLESQMQEIVEKKQEYEKQLLQLKEESFSREKSHYKFQLQSIKEKDKKNIELFSQIKVLQQSQKEHQKSIQELRDESEKLRKKVQLKNVEIKQYIEQNRTFQEKNTELSDKINQLQSLLQQQELNFKDFKQSPKSRSLEQSRVISQYLQPNLNQQQLNLYINQYKNYRQEFQDLKIVIANKLKQDQILQNQLQKLQDENSYLNQLNSKLIQENKKIYENRIITKRISEEFTTGPRCSAATGESIHMRSFFQQCDDDLQINQKFNIFDLLEPELLSTEETLHILKQILIRSVNSFELIKRIYHISEIKELLFIFSKIDEKFSHSNKKLNQIINLVLGEKRKQQWQNGNQKPDFLNS